MKIESLQGQLDKSLNMREYALSQLICKDAKIADLEYRFQCSMLLLEESLNIIQDETTPDELKCNYMNRAMGFLAVNHDKIRLFNKEELKMGSGNGDQPTNDDTNGSGNGDQPTDQQNGSGNGDQPK